MTLKDRISDDVKSAMRTQDKARVAALRLVLAAIKQREVDERIVLDDAQTLAVLERMLKQRRESLELYQQGKREDLARQESYEIDLLLAYLPQPLGADEIDALVAEAIAQCAATSARDMGKVMNVLRPRVQGRADMTAVSQKVKQRLA